MTTDQILTNCNRSGTSGLNCWTGLVVINCRPWLCGSHWTKSKIYSCTDSYFIPQSHETAPMCTFERVPTPYFWSNFLYGVEVYPNEHPTLERSSHGNGVHLWNLRSTASLSTMHMRQETSYTSSKVYKSRVCK